MVAARRNAQSNETHRQKETERHAHTDGSTEGITGRKMEDGKKSGAWQEEIKHKGI